MFTSFAYPFLFSLILLCLPLGLLHFCLFFLPFPSLDFLFHHRLKNFLAILISYLQNILNLLSIFFYYEYAVLKYPPVLCSHLCCFFYVGCCLSCCLLIKRFYLYDILFNLHIYIIKYFCLS